MCVSPYIVEVDGCKVPVPCGKCIECLRDYQNDWAFRLTQEVKKAGFSWYLTLTFAPKKAHVAYNKACDEWQTYVEKRDVQLFLKRLRKRCPELRHNLKYFAIGEYGGDYNRAHYHIVLCSSAFPLGSYAKWYRIFLSCWHRGFIKLKMTSEKNIGYVTKYMNKLDDSPHITKPFKLMSKGLGLCYLTDKMVNYFFNSFAVGVPFKKGYIKLPRYYKKKLDQYSENHPYMSVAGLTYSDVLRLQNFPRKGIQKHFQYFCDNFDTIYRDIVRLEVRFAREKGYHLPVDMKELTTNQVFKIWCSKVKAITDVQRTSDRCIEDIKVRHLFTRLSPNDLMLKCPDYLPPSKRNSRKGTSSTYPLNRDFLPNLVDLLP